MSEAGAGRCVRSGAIFGLDIHWFEATTRFSAVAAMQLAGLQLNRRFYCAISDEAIGDRDQVERGTWWLTTPELGCFMSHFRLWELTLQLDEPVLILEHDVEVVTALPELPSGAIALNLDNTPWPGSSAYLITPGGARLAIKEARKRGIQPVDELLWRAALRKQRVAYCAHEVARNLGRHLSTIQFTRRDERHKNILNQDPWVDYSGKTSRGASERESVQGSAAWPVQLATKSSA